MSTGVLASVLSSVVLAMLTAIMVINEKLSEDMIHYASFVITLVSSVVGSLLAGKKIGGKYAMSTFLTGGVYYLVLMGTGILFFDGLTAGVWTILTAIVIGSFCACAICIMGKGRRGRRKMIYR
jgi:putative membrane protein (TIGR04086 family)